MKYIITLLLLAFSVYVNAQNITVNINGIESAEGTIRLKVFTSSQDFDDNKAFKEVSFSKAKVKNGKLTVSLTLKSGTYGLSFLDDTNNNNKMDFNWMKMPEEGFGFSDFYLTGLSRPSFEDFDFTIKEGEQKTIEVKMRYL